MQKSLQSRGFKLSHDIFNLVNLKTITENILQNKKKIKE